MTEITIGGASDHEAIMFYSDNYKIRIKTFPNIKVGDVQPINRTKNDEYTIIPAILVIFTILELLGRIHIWYIFRVLFIVVFIATLILLYRYHNKKSFNRIRMNHGAEHKVIEAYRHGNINNAGNTSRIVKGCGSNIMVPILVMVFLGDWISYPFTLSLIYYLSYRHIRPIRNILFEIIGKHVQYLTTKEPTADIIDAARIGLLKLIKQERI